MCKLKVEWMLLNSQVWFSFFGIAIRERGEDAGMGVRNQKAVMGGHGLLSYAYNHRQDFTFPYKQKHIIQCLYKATLLAI